MKRWQDVWGYFSAADAGVCAAWAAAAPPESTVVELGSLLGRSALAWVEAWQAAGKTLRLVCVDYWLTVSVDHKWVRDGGQQLAEHGYQSLDVFVANTAACRAVVSPLRCDAIEAARLFDRKAVWGVYIDASHDRQPMEQMLTAWLPRISAGGRIGGHDYESGWPGVVQAVDVAFGKPDRTYGSSWEVTAAERSRDTTIQP